MTERRPLTMNRSIVLSIAATVAMALASPWQGSVQAQANPPASKRQPPSLSLIQKLRAFLGLNPPVAVGGSRSGDGAPICLVSPWPGATVGLSRPVLQAVGPLNELRIERAGVIVWRQRASSTQPIEGPVAWPIEPLNPGEAFTIRVRPRGAAGGDFAAFPFKVASAEVLAANQRQIAALGSDPAAWVRALAQLSPRQGALAAALLSSPDAPADLRGGLGCGDQTTSPPP